MPNALDISGQRYGRLVAIAFAGHLRKGSQPKRAFLFRCDCGAEVVKTLMDVRRADTSSCGCHKKELAKASGEQSRLTHGESSFRSLLATYRRRAKELGVCFTLTEDGFRELTKAPCYYCNVRPSQSKKANRQSFGVYQYNGIDRLDPSLGYSAGNVAPCCGRCNRAKGSMPVNEFLDWIRRVYRWRVYDDA